MRIDIASMYRYRFLACNVLIVALSIIHQLSLFPEEGIGYIIEILLHLSVISLMLLLFAEMFKSMANSNIQIGQKIAWGLLLFVTFYLGALVYYFFVFRGTHPLQES